MNTRRGFLSNLVKGAAAVVAIPFVAKAKEPEEAALMPLFPCVEDSATYTYSDNAVVKIHLRATDGSWETIGASPPAGDSVAWPKIRKAIK